MTSRFRIAGPSRTTPFALTAVSIAAALAVAACGGGGSDSSGSMTPQSVDVPMTISDASSQDWSSIQVTLTSVVFTSASGNTANLLGAPMTVNLEQLDNLGEALGSAQLTAGVTYTGAILTLSANPGDISLTVASDRETGFPEPASAVGAANVIPAARIQIQGAQGAAGSRTVTVPVTFVMPFVAPAPVVRHDTRGDDRHRHRVRSRAPRLHRRSRSARRWCDALGRQLQGAGTAPSDRRPQPPGAAPHVRNGRLGVERQHDADPDA